MTIQRFIFRNKALIFSLAVFIAVGATAIALHHHTARLAALAPAAGPGGAPQGMPVNAAAVTTGTMEKTIEAVGSLQSNESIILRPEISGLVKEVAFAEGQPVEKGALLIRLDDSIYKAQLAQAQAALVLSQANYARALDLFQKKIGTASSRDDTKAKLDVDRAGIDLAKAQLAKTELRAPFAGVAGLRKVSVGDYVSPGQDIVNLEEIDPLKADFRVAEIFLPQVHKDQELHITVDALPGKIFTGKVFAIDPRVDEGGRSIVIRALVPNTESALRPGLFARISLVVETHENALQVPEQSLMPQGDKQSVYKVVDGKAVMTPVEIGMRRQGMVEILSGLAANDQVITAGQMKVQPDAPVTVIPAAGATPPPADKKDAIPADKGAAAK